MSPDLCYWLELAGVTLLTSIVSGIMGMAGGMLLLAVMLAYAVNNALQQSFLAQVFPLGVSVPSLLGMLGVIAIIASGKQHSVVFDTEADMKQWLDSPGGGQLWGRTPHDEYVRDNFVGTVEQVGEKVQEFVDAGCREFVLWFRDAPRDDSLEAFARDVVPLIRG